jgi:hypothetical protein
MLSGIPSGPDEMTGPLGMSNASSSSVTPFPFGASPPPSSGGMGPEMGQENPDSQYTIPQADESELIRLLFAKKSGRVLLRPTYVEKDLIVDRVIRDINAAIGTNRIFREDHIEFYRNWRGVPETIETGPIGEHSANLKVPMTSTFIEQWKARALKVLEEFSFEALDPSVTERDLKELNDWFKWELENVVGFEDAKSIILHHLLVDGIAMPIPTYEHVEKDFHSSYDFDFMEDVSVVDQMYQAMDLIFQGSLVEEINNIGPGKFSVSIKRDEDPAEVSFSLDKDCLRAEVVRREIVFDGVKVFQPNLEDVAVINSHEDLEQLPFFVYRTFMPVAEFKRECEKGGCFDHLDEEDKDQVLATAAPKVADLMPLVFTKESDQVEGATSIGYGSFAGDPERFWIEIYRWESLATIGSEERIGVCAWIAGRARKVLKLVRLEELNKDGKRSPVKFDFIKVPGRFYGIGLAEWLRHSQTEIDGIHNYRLNSGLICNIPFFFYTPAAGQPKDILQIEPGKGYPVKDPKGVVFPQIPWNAVWGFQEEGLTRKYASEQAGIGDPGVGTFTSKRTSAAEFVGTQQSIDIRTELMLRAIARQFEELLTRIFGLYQQHAKSGRVFQIEGENGEKLVRSLKKDRLHGKVLIRMRSSFAKLSQQGESQNAINMFQLLLNPLLSQLGIVRPDTIYQALSKVAKTMEYEGKFYKPNTPPQSPEPWEEHDIFKKGTYVDPHMGESIGEHMEAHMKLRSDPMLGEFLSEECIAVLDRHIQATVQMQQQIQMQQQMQAEQAAAMQARMEQMGIRPGLAGSTEPAEQSGPGTEEEGVAGGMPEGM